jgi:hypothetical protein
VDWDETTRPWRPALERLLAVDATHVTAHQLMATMLLKKGDGRRDLEHLDHCVRLGMASAGTHGHRAIALA